MKVLLVINLQIDFCPGGAVSIAGGDELVPLANEWMKKFDRVVGVRDWHPAEHVSFASTHLWRRPGQVMQVGVEDRSQLLWQMHGVQGSFGAEWAPGLAATRFDIVIDKGTDAASDGYSAFAGTNLEHFLLVRQTKAVYIMGMATEYDVKRSAMDAVRLGFETHVLQDGCRSLHPEQAAAAFAAMAAAGVEVE